ncbi:unnamed protein product [Effrenium voratum]|nr:unnamed protein product [Effrenium voratum]
MKDDFDDFLNASGDEEDEQLEKTTRPARGGSPSYRGGEGGYASYGLGRYGLRADPYADIDLDRPTPKVSKRRTLLFPVRDGAQFRASEEAWT